jgi:hypothetical protein
MNRKCCIAFAVLVVGMCPCFVQAQVGHSQPSASNPPTRGQQEAIIRPPFLDVEEGTREWNAQQEREARLKMEKANKDVLRDIEKTTKVHEAAEHRRQAAHQTLNAVFALVLAVGLIVCTIASVRRKVMRNE